MENKIRENLIKNLKNETYCRLGISPINGIGVFAIRDIPEGTNPFLSANEPPEKEEDNIIFQQKEIEGLGLDPEVLKMVKDFFVFSGGRYFIPKSGLNSVTIAYFMNHSLNPNIGTKDAGEFSALRTIKSGEELTFNYDSADIEKEF